MSTPELEHLRKFKMAFADLLGIEFVAASKDMVRARLVVRPEVCTRPSTIHGGALMAFADTLGAAGTVVNLPEGHATTTIESKTNFLSGAPLGTVIIGEATPVHRGRRTQVWQTRITRESDGGLVALVTQTQMVLEPKPAKA
jgi:1,4-dihydroxy-2-naphthoyl-CoA hydrolase